MWLYSLANWNPSWSYWFQVLISEIGDITSSSTHRRQRTFTYLPSQWWKLHGKSHLNWLIGNRQDLDKVKTTSVRIRHGMPFVHAQSWFDVNSGMCSATSNIFFVWIACVCFLANMFDDKFKIRLNFTHLYEHTHFCNINNVMHVIVFWFYHAVSALWQTQHIMPNIILYDSLTPPQQ